jgi:hypothetical protein
VQSLGTMDAGKFHHESGVTRQFRVDYIGEPACAEVFFTINSIEIRVT